MKMLKICKNKSNLIIVKNLIMIKQFNVYEQFEIENQRELKFITVLNDV